MITATLTILFYLEREKLEERIMTLRRAGLKTHHLDYWNWFEDGWIYNDSGAVNNFKKKLDEYFGK